MFSALLPFCAAFPLGAAQMPAMPHPSLPVKDQRGEAYMNDEMPGYGRWVALEPGWLAHGTDLDGDSRASLLNRVAAARGLSDAQASDWVSATSSEPVVVSYRIVAEGVEVLAGRESVPLGRATALTDSRRLSEILDFDVEIASGSGILDPVVGQQYSGTSLALEVLPLPGVGWQVEVALVHSTSELGGVIEDGYAQMDGKMRLIEHVAECGFLTTSLAGQATNINLADLGPGNVALEFSIEGPTPSQGIKLDEELFLVAVPTLARSANWSKQLASIEEEGIVWSNSQGYLVFEGEDAQLLAASAAALAAVQSQPIGIDVSVQTIRDGVEEAPATMSLIGLTNSPIVFAQGTVRDALTDWDVEVAQVSRVADPFFENIFSGATGDFVGRRRADGKLEVDLDLSFRVVELGEGRRVRLAAATGGETGYDGKVPASPAQDLSIETPEVGELRFQGTYVADDEGRIMLVRSARSLLGEATRLRVVLQVR